MLSKTKLNYFKIDKIKVNLVIKLYTVSCVSACNRQSFIQSCLWSCGTRILTSLLQMCRVYLIPLVTRMTQAPRRGRILAFHLLSLHHLLLIYSLLFYAFRLINNGFGLSLCFQSICQCVRPATDASTRNHLTNFTNQSHLCPLVSPISSTPLFHCDCFMLLFVGIILQN